MREVSTRRVPVMTRAERTRLAFLTSTHPVDDLYQGAVPALWAAGRVGHDHRLPAAACALTFGLRDPR